MKFGQFEIQTFVESRFRLDGGLMFGVVPKSMWNKLLPADDNNLVPMHCNLFVLTAHGKRMVFDVGLGDTLSDREKKVYSTSGESNLDSGLASLGLTPADIDYAILSHLHTDHAGGAVKLVDGAYVPRFPNAKYIIEKKEWDAAFHANERTSAVYIQDRLRPLQDHGQVQFIEASTELFPGIRAVFTGGHSEGHYAIEMESEGKRVYYYGDLLQSYFYARLPFVPAADIYPIASLEAKRIAIPRIVDQDVVVAFDHAVHQPLGRIKSTEKQYILEPVD
ncbi:MAG: MBL fold metallo-hydrolase [bacterium]|nr:MBL fold metallo-hydrolase [bacterium]